MKYKSKAWWPKDSGLSLGNVECTSEDFHHSEAEARSVCKTLEQKGFGCLGEIYPIKTEISLGKEIIHID